MNDSKQKPLELIKSRHKRSGSQPLVHVHGFRASGATQG